MTWCWEPLQQASSDSEGIISSLKMLHRKLPFEVASLPWERLGPPGCPQCCLPSSQLAVVFCFQKRPPAPAVENSHQVTPDAQVYHTSLNYNPLLTGSAVVVCTSPAVVPLPKESRGTFECHHHRASPSAATEPLTMSVPSPGGTMGVKPMWVPFCSTLSSEEKLLFSLCLMDADRSAGRISTIFQLGEVFHFQAGVNTENQAPLRLFVDNCVATPTPDRSSSPQVAFIDSRGCLVGGQLDDATLTSISPPRPRQDVLQFGVDVFRFAGGSSNLVTTCHLKVSLSDQAPDPLNKACSFNKASNLEQQLAQRPSRRLHAPSQWEGGCVWRELPSQLDHLWMVLGLAIVAGLVLLTLAVLGVLAGCWKPSNPPFKSLVKLGLFSHHGKMFLPQTPRPVAPHQLNILGCGVCPHNPFRWLDSGGKSVTCEELGLPRCVATS
ncbi:PREDICTED: LOW QUALITY PROTEIN: zona pellucida sperm-binding protein 3-like [Calidris pugnax]|uniref:LOW QUALITY PROTEIN: zona pellucida sperm-binding protein 3-like n=1 Tax=Calidris pugnax TaxID=198806 RepID=UPI00071D2A69|nr:PREDICTED: LOW QUALITY PROTEIN: zona pellucida sperm-binding protein 3-like [Calidris pugnax]